MPRHTPPQHQAGISMIELIVVITVLGIIAAGTAIYLVRSMQAYTDSVRRDALTAVARAATERVVRELRNAAPNSIRINPPVTAPGVTTHCIEFVPVDGAGAYLEDLAPKGSITSFNVVPYTPPPAGNRFVVIYPYATAALYGNLDLGLAPGPAVAPCAGNCAPPNPPYDKVLLSNHHFDYDSPRRRFFLTGGPVSFCIDGASGRLDRYSGYGFAPKPAAPPAAAPALVAEHLQLVDGGASVTPFRYDPGDLSRAGVVTIDFRFMQDGEWVRLQQEVQIRNAP